MAENNDENIDMTVAEIGQTLDIILDDKPKTVLSLEERNMIHKKRYMERVRAYELTLVPKDVVVFIEEAKVLSSKTSYMTEFIPFLKMLLKYLNGGEPLKNDFGFDRYTSLYSLSTFNSNNDVSGTGPDTPMIFKIFEKLDTFDFSSLDYKKTVSFKDIMESILKKFASIDELRGHHPRRQRYVMYVGASPIDYDDNELFEEFRKQEIHFSCFSLINDSKLIEAFQKLNFNDKTNDFSAYYTLKKFPVALVHGFDQAFSRKRSTNNANSNKNKDTLENDLISMVTNPEASSNLECKSNVSEMDPNYQQIAMSSKQQIAGQSPLINKTNPTGYYPYGNTNQKPGAVQIQCSTQEPISQQVHTPNSNMNVASLSSMSQAAIQAAPNSVQSSHRSTPTSVVPSPQINNSGPISSNTQQIMMQNVVSSDQIMYDSNPQTMKTSSPALSCDTINMAPQSVPPRTPQATTPVIPDTGPMSQQSYQSQHSIPQYPSPASTPARYPNLAYSMNNSTPNPMAIISATGPMYQQPNQISTSNSSLSVGVPPQAKRPMLINNSTSSSSSNLHNPSNSIVTSNPSVNMADTAVLFQGDLKYNVEMTAAIQVSVVNAKNQDLNFLTMSSWDKQSQLNFFPLFDSLKCFFAGISLTNFNSLDGSDKDGGANSNQPVSAELVLAMNPEALSIIINMLNSKNQVNFAFVQPCKDISPDLHVQLYCMLSTGHGLKVFIPKDPKGLISEMRRKAASIPQNIDQRRNPMMANYYGNFGQPYTIASGSGHHHQHRPSLMINHHRYSAPGIQPGQVGLMSSAPSIMVAPAQQAHFYRAGIPQPPPGSFIQTPGGIIPAQQQPQYIAASSGNANMAPGIGGIVVTQQQQMVNMDAHHHPNPNITAQ